MAKAKKRGTTSSYSNIQETLAKFGAWVEELVSGAMPNKTASKPRRKVAGKKRGKTGSAKKKTRRKMTRK